ncbi:cadmium-translocating P-type ATPase [Helicobacter enhydrae]|uniref:P-type Zn(2+) transporter n=1 Tax=Helicobacter enhydrae TaxID=222136 RepID=A0A1B1U617_9HELI|nr:heavy metal translocating P-type ATPase [Helicobacter enhydrae]ANV98135.1 cadmium-translocating P-type ATPase [Helicobacter enhydrae]
MKKYHIKHLDCPNCANALEDGLRKCAFVQNVRIDFASGVMFLDTSDFPAVLKAIEEIESGVALIPFEEESSEGKKTGEIVFLATLIAGFLLCVWSLHSGVMKPLAYAALFCIYVVAGIPVFRGAYKRILAKEFFDEHFLMLFATISAVCIGAYLEAVAVILFFRVGDFFERMAVHQSRKNINALMDFNPSFAWKKQANGEVAKVMPQDLEVDDVVVVRAGEKIPSDGIVCKGESEVDQKALNGESLPRFVGVGDSVLGGSINLVGVLEVRITQKYENSTIAGIVDLIANASGKKAKTEKMITAFARIYTPIVLVVAVCLVVFAPLLGFGSFEEWFYRALVVVMVSCPCALVLSVPLGYFGGIGGASKNGILIKGANILEALAKVQKVMFDKTGTLTQGAFEVVKIVPYGEYQELEVLKLALCAEHLSNHPIAQSLQKCAKDLEWKHQPIQHTQLGGMGISAQCCGHKILVGNLALLESFGVQYPDVKLEDTAIHIALEGKYVGHIIISDEPKKNASAVIARLKSEGIEVAMLSGDNAKIVQKIAKKLGIEEAYGDLLPKDKLDLFASKKQKITAFVGDGVNDAPVLNYAEIGISMGISGSDLSKESADVILVNDDLSKIPQAIEIAKKTKKIIVQNIVFALGVKGVFIVLGVFGVAGMWEAVFGDVGVALLALLNASRIVRV